MTMPTRTAAARSLAVVLLGAALSGSALAAPSARLVVVEEFQSQGCSSCPPANANLNAIADRTDVLALSFAVTYWDQLGWKDTFDSPAYTARQWDYAHTAGRPQVATPQMIINGGRNAIVGGNRQQLDAAIAHAKQASGGPAITAAGGKVTIAAAAGAGPATVWLVRYDPRVQNVSIRAGENGGRTLPHRNIVRSLQSLGTWRGTAASFAVPAGGNPAYRTAVFVQHGKGGAIVAAARI